MIVVSDGWDRGDPALVATETARLRRNCHRLVWLNPLAGTPGYQPLAGGMRAAYPYIDDFLPAGTVASLERLGEILGGVRAGDTRRGSEAAAHAALPDGRRARRSAGLPARRRRRDQSIPSAAEATAMKELLETLRGWERDGRRTSAAPSWSGRSAPRRDRRAPSSCTPTTAGSPARSAAAASRAPRPRRSSARARPATPGSSATASATSRRGTSGSPAAARSTSSSSRSRRPPIDAAGIRRRRRPRLGRHHATPRGLAAGRVRAAPAGDGAPPERRLVVADDGTLTGSLGSRRAGRRARRRRPPRPCARASRGRSRLGGRSLFIEAFPVRPRLVIVGAVEVARSLVRLARELGYETVVVDGRAAFATPERFPDVDRLVVGWPDEVADEIGLGPNDAVAVLTHDVKFDEPAIVEALRRGCRYVGAVGSQKTQARPAGAAARGRRDDGDLARLRGPVGLDLGGREPAETALAIIAEIVAERLRRIGPPDARADRPRSRAGADAGRARRADRGRARRGCGSRFGGGKLLGHARRPADPAARPRRARRAGPRRR